MPYSCVVIIRHLHVYVVWVMYSCVLAVIIVGSLLVVSLHHQLDGRAHSEGCDTVLYAYVEERQKVHCLNILFSKVGWGVGRGVGRGGRREKEGGGQGRRKREEGERENLYGESEWTCRWKVAPCTLSKYCTAQSLLRIFDSFHALTVSASSQSYTCKLLHSQRKRSSKYM